MSNLSVNGHIWTDMFLVDITDVSSVCNNTHNPNNI